MSGQLASAICSCASAPSCGPQVPVLALSNTHWAARFVVVKAPEREIAIHTQGDSVNHVIVCAADGAS